MQVGRGYPVSFDVTNDSQTTTSAGNAFGTIVQPVLSSLNYTNASISGPLLSRRHFSSNLTLGLQRQGAQAHSIGELSLSYNPTSYDGFTLESSTGFIASPTASFPGIADPPSLQFNCDAHNAVGFGPSIPSNDSGSARTALSWNHTGKKFSTTLSLHHEIDFNAPIGALVNGSVFPRAFFTPAYMAGVQQNYAATCGATTPLMLGNLSYQTNAAVPHVSYDGGELSLHVDASRNVIAEASYAAMLARAYGSRSLIFSPGSTVIGGRQLPNQPIHTGNLSLAAGIGRAGVTALANLHYISANNPNNLPAYTTVDAGLDLPLKHGGSFTVSLLNLTDTHAGTFATTAGAVPLATETGRFATIASPLIPHSLNFAWRLPFGPGAQLRDVPEFGPGPEAYGFKLYPYPNTPPSDPFAVDRRSGRCGPEIAPIARHYLDLVHGYVRRIETARVKSGSYPDVFGPQIIEGMQLYYRRNGRGYAILLAVDTHLPWSRRLTILKPFTGCTRIYSGFLQDTRRRDIYIPPYEENKDLSPFIDFTAQVGFYYPPSLIENETLFPIYGDVPKEAPQDPFALSKSAHCSANIRPAGQAVVSLLRPYTSAFYDEHEKPQTPVGFQITPHAAPSGTWLEISSDDLDVKILSHCLAIAALDRTTLQKMGLDGTTLPTLDYTPRLGFYNKW